MPKVGDVINAENGSWSFAVNEPNTLTEHMRKSIPQYDKGHALIQEISEFFVNQNSLIYDVGCSNGVLAHSLAQKYYGKNALIVGIDCEENFINAAKNNYGKTNNLDFEKKCAIDYPYKACDLVILYYTLQFIDIDRRSELIANIFECLKEGGGLLLFEKSRQKNSRTNDILNQLYIDYKLKNGYSGNEIIAKARSLKGVLEPLSSFQNLQLLERVGFNEPSFIYKELCFDGILAIK